MVSLSYNVVVRLCTSIVVVVHMLSLRGIIAVLLSLSPLSVLSFCRRYSRRCVVAVVVLVLSCCCRCLFVVVLSLIVVSVVAVVVFWTSLSQCRCCMVVTVCRRCCRFVVAVVVVVVVVVSLLSWCRLCLVFLSSFLARCCRCCVAFDVSVLWWCRCHTTLSYHCCVGVVVVLLLSWCCPVVSLSLLITCLSLRLSPTHYRLSQSRRPMARQPTIYRLMCGWQPWACMVPWWWVSTTLCLKKPDPYYVLK